MTPRAVSPRETNNRDSFIRQAPEVQPTDGGAVMAPEQQHLSAIAMPYHEGRQVDGGSGGAEDPSPAGGSRPGGVEACGCAESESDSEGNGAGAGTDHGKFKSTGSFGSVTQETPTRVRSWTWTIPFIKEGACCCDCVALSRLRGAPHEQSASAPETFAGIGAHRGAAFTGKSGFRPRHRRGHSTGSIALTGRAPRRTASIAQQPVGWEGDDSGSVTTSAWSSGASSALAAAAGVGVEESGISGAVRSLSGLKTEVSLGVNALDREFQRVLKAGVDVFKHTSANKPEQWADAVPRRLKGLLSRRCLLDDENQGLVTLFLDKRGKHLCWCAPGAAELVPDESYRLPIGDLVEVVLGDELHPRFVSLRAMGRPNPLVIEFDSDDLFDMVSQGIIHILERNHFPQTLVSDSSAIPPV